MKGQEEQLEKYRAEIRREIAHWKEILNRGCNDPFWPDGCNLNLTRNHVIYYKYQISEMCEESGTPLPEEYYLPTPPEVDNNYMANLSQKERVSRLQMLGRLTSKKVKYEEAQLSLF